MSDAMPLLELTRLIHAYQSALVASSYLGERRQPSVISADCLANVVRLLPKPEFELLRQACAVIVGDAVERTRCALIDAGVAVDVDLANVNRLPRWPACGVQKGAAP